VETNIFIGSWNGQVEYAKQKEKQFVRLDTLGIILKLIEHYASAGFQFLGILN
jgi:hypothetical protein